MPGLGCAIVMIGIPHTGLALSGMCRHAHRPNAVCMPQPSKCLGGRHGRGRWPGPGGSGSVLRQFVLIGSRLGFYNIFKKIFEDKDGKLSFSGKFGCGLLAGAVGVPAQACLWCPSSIFIRGGDYDIHIISHNFALFFAQFVFFDFFKAPSNTGMPLSKIIFQAEHFYF
jgi:hypothetical protein